MRCHGDWKEERKAGSVEVMKGGEAAALFLSSDHLISQIHPETFLTLYWLCILESSYTDIWDMIRIICYQSFVPFYAFTMFGLFVSFMNFIQH